MKIAFRISVAGLVGFAFGLASCVAAESADKDVSSPVESGVAPPEGREGDEKREAVERPPAVQILMPGFAVRELPVQLLNVNNVKYRDDGTLVALAYDGTVWLLRDTDGDGLEDRPQVFREPSKELRSPIGMDLTPEGYDHGRGLFVAAKDRVVLIVDTDDDDRADKEITVATGWKESFHQVDGLGVAFDRRDGSVYFGRGTYNFADPYLRDQDGNSQYSLVDESAAIVRISPDFKSREVIATGIRFPVGLRFNAQGDLFATDQEGATWLPNGNPFDELLHIQQGRHYGFPPRHPTHLPDIIDEPSTFDYGPQHQSTCGLNFNEPVQSGGPTFGPSFWDGDALVAGYSRGKLYRTQVAKSPAGYVARTHILACLNMLTVDACVSPEGDLIVACHSGGPDWGSGPTGKGRLFKIRYADRELPQPVVAWPAGPREVRIEFDRAVAPQSLRDVLSNSQLTAGRFVRAGDRFETLSPGYAAVQAQKLAERREVPLRSAQLTPDGRTLILATDPIFEPVHYSLRLPGLARPGNADSEPAALTQKPAIDLDFDLSGCEATWRSADGEIIWSGWLPHFDLAASRQFTSDSAPHELLWAALKEPGELTLRGKLDLTDMLRPAVQPGSELDYEYPPETVTVSFETSSPNDTLEFVSTDKSEAQSGSTVSLTVAADAEKIVPVTIRLVSRSGRPALSVHWTTNEDSRPRPLALRRLLVAWAASEASSDRALVDVPLPELEGGNWARGYREFFGEQAACGKCHTIFNRGGTIGPDLSNLVHRDYASVLRDITHPSFAINPDYVSYTITLRDGRVKSGVIHESADTLRVGDSQGTTFELERADVDDMQPSAVSIMPEGVPVQLGTERMRDLMTFLLMPPPQMPRDYDGPRPPPRTHAEVQAMLAGAPLPEVKARPIRVMLIAGPKDHGPGEHDYPAWQIAWRELLSAAEGVDVVTAWEWPTSDELQQADVAVIYQHGDWNPQRAADIDAFLDRGGGMVYIHWAVDGRAFGRELADRIGLAAGDPIAFRHGDVTLAFNRETSHPIIRNFNKLTLVDETYWKLSGALPTGRVLATAVEEGQPQPQLWAVEPGNGRVFVSIPGHYSWTFDDPLFRLLLLRGIAWTAREPVDRFNDLVWPGANLEN